MTDDPIKSDALQKSRLSLICLKRIQLMRELKSLLEMIQIVSHSSMFK